MVGDGSERAERRRVSMTPRLEEAVAELQSLIASHYPEVTFSVSDGDDPEGIYLTATIDVEDMEEVIEVFLDRLVDMQVDEELPVFVVPIRPVERSRAMLAAQQARAGAAVRNRP
jgi:hypothetical protein